MEEHKLLVTGYWLLVASYWLLVAGCWGLAVTKPETRDQKLYIDKESDSI